jgi:hypothetical protein
MLVENQKAAHEAQKSAQQATAELDKQKLELQKKSWTAWMWVQIAVFVVAISVAASLAWHGNARWRHGHSNRNSCWIRTWKKPANITVA